jgi:hypothetical protein
LGEDPLELQVEPAIFELFSGLAWVVVGANRVDNRRDRSEVDAGWWALWEAAGRLPVENAESHPRSRSGRRLCGAWA